MHDIKKDFELSKYRYSSAEETYKNAKMCLDNGFYRDCINRSYYAVFYSMKAVLALSSVDFKRHKDVWWLILIRNMLRQEFTHEKQANGLEG